MGHWLTEPSPRKACKDGRIGYAAAEGDCGLMNGESSLVPEMMGDVGWDEGLGETKRPCAVELSPGEEKTARSVKLKNSSKVTIYCLEAHSRGINPSVYLYDSN